MAGGRTETDCEKGVWGLVGSSWLLLLVQYKSPHRRRLGGGGECGAGWSSSHVDIYSWRLNWSSDCYSAATVALSFLSFFYHCCEVIMMMVLLVVVGQKGRWWRASWRRWRRDGRTGIVSWIETRWIIMGMWRRRGGMESHYCRGGMVWYDVVQRIL